MSWEATYTDSGWDGWGNLALTIGSGGSSGHRWWDDEPRQDGLIQMAFLMRRKVPKALIEVQMVHIMSERHRQVRSIWLLV